MPDNENAKSKPMSAKGITPQAKATAVKPGGAKAAAKVPGPKLAGKPPQVKPASFKPGSPLLPAAKASEPAAAPPIAGAGSLPAAAIPAAAKPEPARAEVKAPELMAPELKASEASAPEAEASQGKPAEPSAAAPAVPRAARMRPAVKPKIKTEPATAPAVAAPVEPIVPVKAAAPDPVMPAPQEDAKTATPFAASEAAEPKAAAKTASNEKSVFAGLLTNLLLEETPMNSVNFAGFQDAMTEAQTKAKAAFEKGTSVLGEVSDFTKGNVEAVVESGKIFAEGVQGLGSEFVSESRSAFEAMTGDIKELAAAKSPTDFFKLQSDLVRKNFDTAVAYGSKNSEAMLKLFSDTFAPISGRVSIAVEKARTATTSAVPSAPTTF